MNTEDSEAVVLDFTAGAGLTVPSLLNAKPLYDRYQGLGSPDGERPWAPYPLQVVVDPEGTIQYINQQYDAVLVREVIDGLLAED